MARKDQEAGGVGGVVEVEPHKYAVPAAPVAMEPVYVSREAVSVDVYFEYEGQDESILHLKDGTKEVVVKDWTSLGVRQERAYIDDDGTATLCDGSMKLKYGPGIPGCYGRTKHAPHARTFF